MITVLLAARNGEAYIREQIDSILAQCQDGIFLVLSDDCSTDGTAEILSSYAAKEKIRVLFLKRRCPSGGAAEHFLALLRLMALCRKGGPELCGGASDAGLQEALIAMYEPLAAYEPLDEGERTALLRAAKAPYFLLSDQDDVWLPEKAGAELQRMRAVEKSLQGGRCPVLIHTDLSVADAKLEIIDKSLFHYQKITPERTRLSELLVQNSVTGGTVMLNAAFLPYLETSPKCCLMHDAWLSLLACCFGRIDCIKEPLSLYRQHGENTLGAGRAGSPEAGISRLKDGSAASENYRRMFAQAEELLRLFGDQLTTEQQETLRAFLRIRESGRFVRMRLMLQYGFTKNTWYRTLGQMLMMGADKDTGADKDNASGRDDCEGKADADKVTFTANCEAAPPLVSICCITYNHAAYIRTALDSFLSQRTRFPFEILIHDDASTDGTQEIIREYTARHPGIIRPILREENQYSRGITNVSRFNFERVRGRYVAMCEGDDYWTDTEKLQRQFDYMEAHPDCMICMHSARVESLGSSKAERLMRAYEKDRDLSPEALIDSPAAGFPMASLFFRADLISKLPEYYVNCPVGDIPLELMAAAKGTGYYMDRPMSVYRVGVSGSWTQQMKASDYERRQRLYAEGMQATYRAFDRATDGRFHEAAERAAGKIRFLTAVNTKRFDEVLKKENRHFYRELSLRTRFFIRLEYHAPWIYDALRKQFRA